MTTLTVTSKGQVTLRKEVLKHLGIGPGDKIDIDLLPNGTFMGRVSQPEQNGSIEDVFGMLASRDGPKLTLDEIKKAIEDGWAGIKKSPTGNRP